MASWTTREEVIIAFKEPINVKVLCNALQFSREEFFSYDEEAAFNAAQCALTDYFPFMDGIREEGVEEKNLASFTAMLDAFNTTCEEHKATGRCTNEEATCKKCLEVFCKRMPEAVKHLCELRDELSFLQSDDDIADLMEKIDWEKIGTTNGSLPKKQNEQKDEEDDERPKKRARVERDE